MNLTSLTKQGIKELADSNEIYLRGESYVSEGLVRQLFIAPDKVTAAVHGNYGTYKVVAEDVGGELETSCTCPYDGDVCKHVVAVLLCVLKEKPCKVEEAVLANIPSALERTLRKMPPDEFVDLILNMANREPDFRKLLLDYVPLSSEVLADQPRKPAAVRKLKNRIKKAVENPHYDDDYYDDGPTVPELDDVLAEVKTLHPDDQFEVLWYMVEVGDECAGDYGIDTDQFAEAIRCYGEAAKALNLNHKDKQPHFKRLCGAFNLSLCGYGNMAEAIKAALDAICSERDDYLHVIKRFETTNNLRKNDWIAEYWLKSGDEKKYLEIRKRNLDREDQYLDLANYWRNKGNVKKYLSVLEDWVEKLPKRIAEAGGVRYWWPRSVGKNILEILTEHYESGQDDENLCRILMITAEVSGISLDRYKGIEKTASKLGVWPECREKLIKLAQTDPRVLADIYLHERMWEAAVQVADRPQSQDDTRIIVADAVGEVLPRESLRLHKRLMEENISRGNRNSYRAAAQSAAKIKNLYQSILNDKPAWTTLITAVRTEHKRRRALIDEFRNL